MNQRPGFLPAVTGLFCFLSSHIQALKMCAVVSGWERGAGPGKRVPGSSCEEETDCAPLFFHCSRVGHDCPQTGLLGKKVHSNS